MQRGRGSNTNHFEEDYPNKENRTHQYKEGTKFSEIVRLYYLNVDLKNILLKYTARIEINIRTAIIYTVSNKFIDSPTWFAAPKVMRLREFVRKRNLLWIKE